MPAKAKCSRCHKLFPRDAMFQWLENDDLDDLSPKFCRKCYFYVLDHYEEGFDVENME